MLLSKFERPYYLVLLDRLNNQSNQCRVPQLPPRLRRFQIRRMRRQELDFEPQINLTQYMTKIFDTYKVWTSDPVAPAISLGVHIAGAYSAIKDIFKRAYEYICDFLDKTWTAAKKFASAAGVFMHSLFDYLRTKAPHMIRKMIHFFKALVGVDEKAENIIEHIAPDLVLQESLNLHPQVEETEDESLVTPFSPMEFNPQSASWITGAFTTLLTLGSTIMYGVSSMNNAISDPAFYLAKVNTLTAFALNIERIDPYKSARRIISLVYKAFTGNHYFEEFRCASDFATHYENIVKNLADTDHLVNPPATVIKLVREEFVSLRKCYDNCLILCPAEMSKIKTQYQHIEDRCRNFYAASYGSDRRIKPVSILMRGPPGCGKSQTQEHFIKQIMNVAIAASDIKETDSDYQIIQEHATRPSSLTRNCIGEAPKHDDGYCYQLFMILEEFQTSKSEELKAEWFNKFMKYIDDAPCPLEMAFKDKGSVYFNSPFVIGTGNFTSLCLPVEHPEAVHRRIDFDVIVAPRDRKDTMFDVTRHVTYKFSTQCLNAYGGHNPPNRTVKRLLDEHPDLKEGFNYDEFLCMVAAVYIERITGMSVPPIAPINYAALSSTGLLSCVKKTRQAAYFSHSLANTVQSPTNAVDISYREEGVLTTPPVRPEADTMSEATFSKYDQPPTTKSMRPNNTRKTRAPPPKVVSTRLSDITLAKQPEKVDNTTTALDDDDGIIELHCGEGTDCHNKQLTPLELFRLITFVPLKYSCSRMGEIVLQLAQLETILFHHYAPGYTQMRQIENPYQEYAKFAQDMYNVKTKFVTPRQRKAADSKRMGTIRWIHSVVSSLLTFCRSGPIYFVRQETSHNMPLRKAYCSMSATQRKLIRTDRPELKLPESARIALVNYEQRVSQLKNAKGRAKRNAARQKMHIAKKQAERQRLLTSDRNDHPRDKIDRHVRDDDGYYEDEYDNYNDIEDHDFDEAKEVFERLFAEERDVDVDRRTARIETEIRYTDTGFDWADDDEPYIPQIAVTTDVSKESKFAPDNTIMESLGYNTSIFYSKLAYSLYRDIDRFMNDREELTQLHTDMNSYYYTKRDYFKKNNIIRLLALTPVEKYPNVVDDLEYIFDNDLDIDAYFCILKQQGWFSGAKDLIPCVLRISKRDYTITDPIIGSVGHDAFPLALRAAQFHRGSDLNQEEVTKLQQIYRKNRFDRLSTQHIQVEEDNLSWIQNVCSIISSVMSIFLTGIVIYGLVSLGLYIHKMITGEEDDDDYLIAQSMSDYEAMNPHAQERFLTMLQSKDNYRAPHKGARKPKSFLARYSVTPQSASQDTQLRKIFANQYSVCQPNGHRLAGCTFVNGNTCLMNRHVFNAGSEFILVPYVPSQAHQCVTVHKDHITLLNENVDRDYVLFTVPGVQPHADIRKKFISRSRYNSSTNFGVASIMRLDQTGEDLPVPTVEPVRCHGIDATARDIKTLGITTTGKFVYTFLNAAPGECGNFVVCYGNGDDFTIVGMHMAARDKNSVGTPIFLEDLYYTLEDEDDRPVDPQADISLCLDDPIVGAYSYNTETFKFETPVLTNPTNKTTLAPTPFATCDPPLFGDVPVAPCELTNTNYLNTLKKEESMECCRNPAPIVISTMIDYKEPIVEALLAIRAPVTYLAGCKTLTSTEALYGAKAYDLAPFDFKTADGIRLKILGIKKIFLQYMLWCSICQAACPDDTCPHCSRTTIPNPHLS